MASTHWRITLGRYRRLLIMTLLRVLPRRSLVLLPGSSKTFGPPRRWSTWADYRKKHDCEWREVLPPLPCRYSRADSDPGLAAQLWREGWPAQGVALIPHARVLDSEGWPIGKQDTLLIDLAIGRDLAEYTAFLSKRCILDSTRRGRALNLGVCHARENYCHFLLEALPRLELFLRAGFTFDDVDWVLVPDFIGSARESFFQALGLPENKIVRLAPGRQYAFDLLYQPSFPGRESFIPPWVVEFYRERLLKPLNLPQEKRRRLYVSRRQRGISNDDAVWVLLQSRGFIRLEPATWQENIHAFASAEAVVGPHGAGLSNVVFCPPGAHLIELIPGDRPFPYFYSAACAAGMSYHALLTSPLIPPNREYTWLPSDDAQPVDVEKLGALLDSLSLS
ncbi:MAG: glycosyltransferase family 61 protein [Nibricoccus sp.]